ncbi:MAG: 3-isopropylmalate dehydratase small subunit [Trueperaceae bacterium]
MALAPISKVVGRAVHVPGDDIDTDRIIPARYLKCVTFDDLGEHLFKDVRFDEDGRRKGHPLDDPRFQGATVLLSGANFGCGSSREHAPQSLYRHGIRAIIAVTFAEIFFGNCTTLGLPCVEADAADVKRLAQEVATDPAVQLSIDLEERTVRAGDLTVSVRIPESARSALLAGHWDPIADLLEGRDEVAATARALPYLGRSEA